MKKRKRATKTEIQERMDEVIIYLRQGIPESRIRRMLVEQKGISDKTASRIIKATWHLIGGLGTQASDTQRGLVLARLNHLFNETTTGPNKNIDQAIKLLGLQQKMLPTEKGGTLTHETTSEDTLSPQIVQIMETLSNDQTFKRPKD